ncbi:MAG TPA: S8 family serine peptidase [Polyangiales bacterium]|nr:S8 family serine peptidase [Polyangiales bacterium]
MARTFLVAALCLFASTSAHAQSTRYAVLQLERGVPSELRSALARSGYRELRILPGQRLLLEKVASADHAPSVYGLPLRAFEQAERISAELLLPAAESKAVPVLIHAMPGSSGEAVLQWLSKMNLPRLGLGKAGDTLRISTRMPQAWAAELAALDEVFFVERIHHLGLFNDRSAGTVQSGTQGIAEAATPIWAKGLRGEGQIVGLIDTGVDADGCWYSGASEKLPKTNTWSEAGGYGKEVDASHSKIIAYDFLYSCDQFKNAADCDDPAKAAAWDSNGHGTHCSGSMVGHRESGGNNGMAPAAKLVAQDAGYKTNDCADLPGLDCPVVDLYPMFEQAYMQGVRIHNNSYGDNENAPTPQPSNYSARSQDVDRFMWEHKDMLLVFAAGNSGQGNAEFSVCSPSTNKNGLSVGSARTMPAANSDDDLSSFSSRGWTADGRIKPDLIAPGCNTSAGNDRSNASHNCTENSGCGTSYAAPTLVGAAALVRQYLTEGFYPSGAKNAADALQPTAAALKAILLNSAVSMKGKDNAGQAITPVPSNEQGWGRIQLDQTLLFQGASRKLFLDDHKVDFATGATDVIEYSLGGLEAGEPLKVTLTWTDYPGTPDAAPRMPKLDDMASFNPSQLVNDLDLEVSDGTMTYLGNVWSGGKSEPGGMPDHRNNVEQVLLPQPTAGNWTVRVKAGSIAKESQDFALVITGKWASAVAGMGTPGSPGSQPSAAGSGALPAAGAAAPSAGAAAPSGAAMSASTGVSTTASAGAAASPASAPSAGTRASNAAAGAQSSTLAQSAQPTAGTSAALPTEAPKESSGCNVSGTSSSKSWPLWILGACWLALRGRTRMRVAVAACAARR